MKNTRIEASLKTIVKMKVVVTGASGFLGSRVADYLLSDHSPITVTELVLVDIQAPPKRNDPRVSCFTLELSAPGSAELLITKNVAVMFHLAAIVSGHAEADFDLGLRVNFDATRALLHEARRTNPSLIFVFTSTVGVFGGNLPEVIDDLTAVTPQNSYGTAKAMSELLINDCSRKGFVDGRIVRLPTVSVRAGTANRAVTSFASGIIREPLNGERSVCPVPPDQKLWLASPEVVVKNIVYAATLLPDALGPWRAVNLPGFCISVHEMLQALKEIAGERVVALVSFERDELISNIVASFPVKFDNSRALNLGFTVDKNFADVIRAYIRNDLKRPL